MHGNKVIQSSDVNQEGYCVQRCSLEVICITSLHEALIQALEGR